MTATVHYTTVLHCDAPGCRRQFHKRSHWSYTRDLARQEEGWSYDSLLGDFCDEHHPTTDSAVSGSSKADQ